jgi:hypothetical protein
MHASLSYLAKWMLKCMLGWRGNFGPAMHMGMQNAYACPYALLIGLSLGWFLSWESFCVWCLSCGVPACAQS